MCMQMRGVEKQNLLLLPDFTGVFNQAGTREEFMNLIQHAGGCNTWRFLQNVDDVKFPTDEGCLRHRGRSASAPMRRSGTDEEFSVIQHGRPGVSPSDFVLPAIHCNVASANYISHCHGLMPDLAVHKACALTLP